MRGSTKVSKNKNKNRFPGGNKQDNYQAKQAVNNPVLSKVKSVIGIASKAVDDNVKISKADYEEYQVLKKSLKNNGEFDTEAIRKSKEKEIDDILANEMQKKREKLEKEAEGSISQLNVEIKEALVRKKDIEIDLKKLKDSYVKVEEDLKRIIDKANADAKKITDKAEKRAEKINESYTVELTAKEAQLEKKEEEHNDKELEINVREKVLKTNESNLAKKEEIYLNSNPDKIISLESEIEQKKLYIEELRSEYFAQQESINHSKTMELKVNGRSFEVLLEENKKLMETISGLEDKCNRFTEYELLEMNRALEEAPLIQKKMDEITRELIKTKGELTRRENSKIELETLKAQMDLIRTLNDHLRQELETNKWALESRVGEVCVALTSIDVDEADEKSDSMIKFENRKTLTSKNLVPKTLFDIVQHVKKFAASQEPALFYEERDIRAYFAGLAASKLTILQGLSGTGKTSLPKIIADAIHSEKQVVPVESSWRDRNELLGYYNDFNRKFTAKEFTCHLYRAGMPHYSDTPFFIILDEMNLSRAEYYFADFLSILEDPNKMNWELKLCDVDLRSLPSKLPDEVLNFIVKDGNSRIVELTKQLYNQEHELLEDNVDQKEKQDLISFLSRNFNQNNDLHHKLLGGPQNLINGNTIKIPENVWFIGTVNRDESTFEISDKVYDRAQVLNFYERAKGERGISIDSIYVPYKTLQNFFKEAIEKRSFDAQLDPLIDKIDKFLRERFEISFGNRITMQMNKFVPVYIAAGLTTGIKADDLKREAIDYQLTNKVLRKLEFKQITKDNLEELKNLFTNENLTKGVEFINRKKQNED